MIIHICRTDRTGAKSIQEQILNDEEINRRHEERKKKLHESYRIAGYRFCPYCGDPLKSPRFLLDNSNWSKTMPGRAKEGKASVRYDPISRKLRIVCEAGGPFDPEVVISFEEDKTIFSTFNPSLHDPQSAELTGWRGVVLSKDGNITPTPEQTDADKDL